MIRYKEFRPTQFDSKGLAADRLNIGEFYVLPCIRTRDSEVLEESNFHSALRMLGGESEEIQVHRFGHWGPGWFELILINPNAEDKVKIAEEIESALADYPILDEMDFSEREEEACCELWESCYDTQDRIEHFRNHSYHATSYMDLIKAVRGSWYHAANLLNCPSDILY